MSAENKKSTIMVVDDTPENLQVLQDMLHSEGYRMQAFRHASAALTALQDHQPDLILLDIMMPDVDGYSLCRSMKKDPRLADIPVIFLSALTDSEAKIRAFAEGGVDYITKPFAAEEVIARVRTHLLIRDQTRKLQEAYAALTALEKQRDQLVHMTVHDMRSPLTATYMILQSFARGDIPGDKIVTTAEQGVHATRRVIDLVTLVLDMSLLENGALPLDRHPVELGTLLRSSMNEFSRLVGKRSLVTRLPEESLTVSCDKTLIQRVIQNMVDNAIRHTDRENGRIEVEAVVLHENDPPDVRVTIHDNGPGIPVEYHDVIFGKYGRLEAADHRSGLGLAFCKMVIDAHGGRIGVDSAPGKGSAFWWTIPTE
jgi:two-component system, sensor histidine kinase and response regulator